MPCTAWRDNRGVQLVTDAAFRGMGCFAAHLLPTCCPCCMPVTDAFGNALGQGLVDQVSAPASSGASNETLKPWQLGSGTYGLGAIGASLPEPELFTQANQPSTMQDIVNDWREGVNIPSPQVRPTVAYRPLIQRDDAGNVLTGAIGQPVYATSVAFAPVNPGRFNHEVHIQQDIDSYVETWNDFPTNLSLIDADGSVILPKASVQVLGPVGSDTHWARQIHAGMNQRLSDAVSNAEDAAVQNRNFLQFYAAQFFPQSTLGAAVAGAGGPLAGLGLKAAGALALTRGPVGSMLGTAADTAVANSAVTQAAIRERVMANIGATRAGNASSKFDLFIAKSSQVESGYAADTWLGVTMRKGDVIYALRPGESAFFTDLSTLRATSLDSAAMSRVLQVRPHDVYGYRPDVAGYRLTQDLFVPGGTALANPAYGAGGGTQYFIQNASRYLEPISTVNLRKPW